jgi:hypothetical protein
MTPPLSDPPPPVPRVCAALLVTPTLPSLVVVGISAAGQKIMNKRVCSSWVHPKSWIENNPVRSIVWKRVVRDLKLGIHSLIMARHEHKKTMMQAFTPLTAEPTIGPGVCEFAMELWNSIFLTLVRSLDCHDVEIDHSLCRAPFAGHTHTYTSNMRRGQVS